LAAFDPKQTLITSPYAEVLASNEIRIAGLASELRSIYSGCAILPVGVIVAVAGFMAYSAVALDRDKAALRALCAPSNLLEVYRSDLYRIRSAETRGDQTPLSPTEQWRTESDGGDEVVSRIPLTAETSFNRLYLMHGDTKVAALKFGRIASLPVLIVQPSTIATCDDTAHRFYVDLLEHEFS